MKLSSNNLGDSNNENNFSHKLLLTSTQVWRFCKVFANGSSDNIKLSKIQLHKIGQSGGFSGRIVRSLIEAGFTLMKYLRKPLAKGVLIPLGLTAATSATDATIHKKMFESGTCPMELAKQTTLII